MPCSRRDFLAATGAGVAGMAGMAGGATAQQQPANGNGSFDHRLDAVADLGCDPQGETPIESTIMDAAADGVLLTFPSGEYRVTDSITLPVSGAFGFVGEGFAQSSSAPKLDATGSVVFRIDTDTPINFLNIDGLDYGQIGNFVIDQRKRAAHGGVQVRSSGDVRVRDIRTVGAQTAVGSDGNPGFFTPFAEGANSRIVYERCIARGGGIPGSKNIGGSPGVSIFGRNGPRGTILLKDCIIENMADNGIYGSRTNASVRVLGGLYRNNDVSQIRVNGDAMIDGATVVIDEDNYTGLKSKSNALEEGPGWPSTNGIKIETKQSINASTGTPIKNCRIIGASISQASGNSLGALVRIWDSAGAVTLTNCRITNNISAATSVFAEEPGSGNYAPAPKPWTITVTNSVIDGGGAGGPAIDIRGRSGSAVSNTCLAYASASPADIRGASISNGGFGEQCQSAGLAKPDKVGSGANISDLPAPDISAGAGGDAGAGNSRAAQRRRRRQKKNALAMVAQQMAVAVLFVLGLVAAVFLIPILAVWRLIS